uniref:DUF4502 domain-containing protein n=1 Tax=Latimeria chalumnae TaxID=7897 RepID=H3A8P8_LATCH
WSVNYAFFPEDDPLGFRKTNNEAKQDSSLLSKAWQRCGEGFQDTPTAGALGPVGQTAVRQLVSSQLSAEDDSGSWRSQEPTGIIWSSSESDFSEEETQRAASKLSKKREQKPKTPIAKYSYNLNFFPLCFKEEPPPLIDWEKVSDQGSDCSEKAESAVDILDSDS